jgi:protease-4
MNDAEGFLGGKTSEAAYIADRILLKRRLRYWKGFALAALALAVLFLFRESVSAAFLGPEGGYVARIRLDGFIAPDAKRDAFLKGLAEDDNVKAVVAHIDSPGGTLVGGEDWHRRLRAISEKKPAVAVVGGMAASGAYMAAIAADRIFVRQGSVVGSVGVIFQTVNVSGLADKMGVRTISYASGRLKGQPSPFDAEIPADVEPVVRDVIADVQEMFMGMVRERRKISDEDARRMADGRIVSGKEAVRMSLADAIGDESDALAWLRAEKGLDKDVKVRDREPEKKEGPMAFLTGKAAGLLNGGTPFASGIYAVGRF